MTEIKIRTNSWLARLAAAKLGVHSCALTYGRCIYLHNASIQELKQDVAWYRHELAHIKQFQQNGILLFTLKYLWYSIRYGYSKNPFEIEARQAETDERIVYSFFHNENTQA